MSLIKPAERELRVHGLGIGLRGFLEVDFRLIGLIIAKLKQSEQQVGLGASGGQGDGELYFLNGSREIVLRSVVVRPGFVSFGIVGLLVAEHVQLGLGLLQIFLDRGAVGVVRRDQNVGEVGASAIVVGSEFDRAGQLLEGAVRVAQFQIRLTQLVMRLSKARVDLNGVGILNCRFTILAGGEIFLAAVEVLLLANVRIAGARGKQGDQRAAQQHAHSQGATHIWISAMGCGLSGSRIPASNDNSAYQQQTVTAVMTWRGVHMEP